MCSRERHRSAVTSTHLRFARPGITSLCLEGPFSVGVLGGIGNKGRECVGVLACKDRKQVESSVESGYALVETCGEKRHVIGALDLGEDGEAFAGITEGGKENFARTVTKVIVIAGVVGFAGILDEDVPAFELKVSPDIGSSDPEREIVHIGSVVDDNEHRVEFLVLTNITATKDKGHVFFLHTGYPLCDIQFEICAEYGILGVVPSPSMVGVAIPETALLAAEGGEVDAAVRLEVDFCATQSAIYTEGAVLVEVEDKSGTKLGIDISDCDLTEVKRSLEAEVAYTVTSEGGIKAGKGPLVHFEACGSL